MPKEACQLARAERFPKAAPLDVIASWGKAAWPWPVGAQAPAVDAVRGRALWVLRARCSIVGTSSLPPWGPGCDRAANTHGVALAGGMDRLHRSPGVQAKSGTSLLRLRHTSEGDLSLHSRPFTSPLPCGLSLGHWACWGMRGACPGWDSQLKRGQGGKSGPAPTCC